MIVQKRINAGEDVGCWMIDVSGKEKPQSLSFPRRRESRYFLLSSPLVHLCTCRLCTSQMLASQMLDAGCWMIVQKRINAREDVGCWMMDDSAEENKCRRRCWMLDD